MKFHALKSYFRLFLIFSITYCLAGCAESSQKKCTQNMPPENTDMLIGLESKTLSQSQTEQITSQIQASQSILLPDGEIWNETVCNGLTVKFLAVGLRSDTPIISIVGNHTEFISQEEVILNNTTPALLLLVDRSQSAAEETKSGTNTHTMEYWLIQHRLRPYPGREDMKIAYVLFATFDTSAIEARNNILILANRWRAD